MPNIEKEYAMLREEMMYNQKHRDHLAQFGYTVTFAVITAALTLNNALLMLCVLPFLFPITLRTAECSHSIAYLASYMKIHLEPKMEIQWEIKNSAYHNKNKRKGIFKYTYFVARLDFPILTFVSSFLFWLLRNFNLFVAGKLLFGIIILVVQLLFTVAECFILLRSVNINKTRRFMERQWKEI